MYFYVYNDDGKIKQVILDEIGIPIHTQEIKRNHNLSEMMMKLENSPKLLVCGNAIVEEEAAEHFARNKLKRNVYLYCDDDISNIVKSLESDDDWENFFEDNEIGYEIASQPEVYLNH